MEFVFCTVAGWSFKENEHINKILLISDNMEYLVQ